MTTKLSAGRWWREVGWRHAGGALAIVFAVVPVLYIVSAAVNPLGTVGSTDVIPTAGPFDAVNTPSYDSSSMTLLLGSTSAKPSLPPF